MIQRIFCTLCFSIYFIANVQAQSAELDNIDCLGLHRAAQIRSLSSSEKEAFLQCVASGQMERRAAGISTEEGDKHGLAGGINTEIRNLDRSLNPFRW